MKTNFALPSALALLLGACASSPPTVTSPPPPEEVIRRVTLKPDDVRRVRTGELVKTYHLGRTTKGKSGRVMHEAHRLYRIEKPNRGNLTRNQPPLASTGPTNKITDPAFLPAPESQSIRTELNHQKKVTRDLEEARDTLIGTLVSAQARLHGTRKEIKMADDLQREAARLRAENDELRKKLASSTNSLNSSDNGSPKDALLDWNETLEAPPK